MLRASLSKETSICAFCRHRLSTQLSTSSIRRLSNTRSLADDGAWGSWGGSQPSTSSGQDDFLSQHEILARKQLLEKRQEKRPDPPTPQPANDGLEARYVWNAERQQDVENNLRRDGMLLQNRQPPQARDIARRGEFTPRRPVPSGFNIGSDTPRSNRPIFRPPLVETLRRGPAPSASDAPRKLVRKVGGRSTIKRISGRPTGFPDEWLAKPTDSPEVDGNSPPGIETSFSHILSAKGSPDMAPRDVPDSNPQAEPSDGEWGLLARKKTAKEADNPDFWAAMGGNSNGSGGAKAEKSNTSEQSGAKNNWNVMEKSIERAQTSQRLSDWGKEFDNAPQYRGTEQEQRQLSSATSETAPINVQRVPAKASQDWDRDQDRRRPARYEERGGGGRAKRSGRASRYDQDDDDGFDYEQYQENRRLRAERKAQRRAEKTGPTPILLPELISITALADALKVRPNKFLSQLGELGFENVTLDSLMAGETAALVAQEYGFDPTVEAGAERDLKPRPPPEDLSSLPQRPPVVTIMGHVDHGKTTLLDYLRKSSIAAQEHGGITQRIGAFSVKLSSGKPITFLDTPGHAAFLTMRQRGAYVTDIVVLVVAADDSVKPQTLEAIKHARSAKVPMIVAINKIDKDGARIDQVKSDLAQQGVEIEDFGGDVQVVCVSGKTGQGMEDLEENILTLSEILDHRAEFDGPAEGWILESSLKPIGKAATVLVKRGTLRPGDYIAAGLTWAKIRHLRSEAGVEIDEAPPGTAVEILGWKDLPSAGDQVIQSPDEGRAKDAVEYREGLAEREKDAAAHEVIAEERRALQEKRAREKAAAESKTADANADALPEEENGTKMVNFVVKGDLHGSVEAVCASLLELGNHEVRARILRSTTGPIHEFDVEHAAMSKSVIVNFATTTPGYIKRLAEEQGVQILDHTVIYHLVDEVKKNLSTYLAPEISSRVLGEAEVLQVFPINVRGRQYKNVAGCRIRNGVVARNSQFRVYRDGKKLFEGNLETLKHVKRDITEAKKGTECGIGFEEFQDLEVGDQIQAYEEVKTPRSL